MPTHVINASIYRADPSAPRKRWIGNPIAESVQVALHDDAPQIAQPFRFSNNSTIGDFVVDGKYWLLAETDEHGRTVWYLRIIEVRPAGKDVMLTCSIERD